MTINGTPLNDVLEGTASAEAIYGRDGDDILRGNEGNDSLFGGVGNDILNGVSTLTNKGTGERDILNGGAGADRFILGDSRAFYLGMGTLDLARISDFNASEDTLQLYGHRSDYVFNLTAVRNSTNIFYKGDLIARLAGVTDANSVIEASSFVLVGTSFNDVLQGSSGDEALYGREGDDTLLGDDGSDKLFGNTGNDSLNGVGIAKGVGEIDILNGGTGADEFILGDAENKFYLGMGNSDFAKVADFNTSEDTLQLHGQQSDYMFGLTASGSAVNISYRGDLIARLTGNSNINDVVGACNYVGSSLPT
jgi:Ca2+-binding RTX toxin-like protein